MKWLITLFFLISGIMVVGQSLLVEPVQFNQLVQDSTIQKLDVRSSTEYEIIGHIPGFIQVSIYDKLFEEKIISHFDKTRPILVTCFSGHRSPVAVDSLSRMGFVTIYELQGGLLNWLGKGYALE